MSGAPPARGRLRVGHARIHAISFEDTLEVVRRSVRERRRLVVFTCNVDHVVQLDRDPAFRAAYDRADLVTADGAPLVGWSRLLGRPLPGRVTGADLAPLLAEICVQEDRTLALVGGAPGVGERAAFLLRDRHPGLRVVVECPPFGVQPGDAEDRAVAARLRASDPAAYLVCLGAPKQELWITRHADDLPPGVLLGAGAALDFIVGVQRRAPRLVRTLGLEFLWRLASDFPRLWRRYLVQDLRFVVIVLRQRFRSR